MTMPRGASLLLMAALVSSLSSAVAQTPEPVPAGASTTAARPASGADRVFLSFAEEATAPASQWWEGQLQYTDDSPFDLLAANLVVAFQPWKNIELGGRVGFGSSDASGGLEDGSGATDLDVWGKYLFAGSAQNDFAVGGLFTVPTGDDNVGLGRDSFDLEVFGSWRHRAQRMIFGAQAGARLNGDGSIGGNPYSGSNSLFLAGNVILPISDPISFVGELKYETERIDGDDSDLRALGGINWALSSRGLLRGAVAAGITDGAPNLQVTVGYAYTY